MLCEFIHFIMNYMKPSFAEIHYQPGYNYTHYTKRKKTLHMILGRKTKYCFKIHLKIKKW